jgi:UDP-GlcNAc:undecaprenyl-phosphate GlcNAc-1-phosphate transferase
MENVITAAIVSFVVTYFAIPILIRVAELKNLYDEPDARKAHKSRIPTLGGLGFFAGFTLATAICAPALASFPLQYFLAAFLTIFFVGIKDDIVGLSPVKKLIGQLVASFLIIYLGDLQIRSFYGVLGIYELSYNFSLLFTYFTFIVVINAFNLIDGVDGLAGSIGFLVAACLGTYFLMVGELLYAVMGFSMAAGLIAFLIYNNAPAKIFMGDTGSLLVGLVNAVLVIKFISVAGNPNSPLPLQSVPAIAFAILIVPLFDTIRVFAIRMMRGRSPFSADRHHIHHYMQALGMSHRQVALTAFGFNCMFIALAFLLQDLGSTLLLFVIGAMALGLTAILFVLKRKKERERAAALPSHAYNHLAPVEMATPPVSKTKILRVNNSEAILQDK